MTRNLRGKDVNHDALLLPLNVFGLLYTLIIIEKCFVNHCVYFYFSGPCKLAFMKDTSNKLKSVSEAEHYPTSYHSYNSFILHFIYIVKFVISQQSNFHKSEIMNSNRHE